MEIKTEGHFSAAHVVDGKTKCNRLHGHNWVVKVTINGEINPDTGMVEDFIGIKDIIDQLDHKTLISGRQIVDPVDSESIVHFIKAGGRDYMLPKDVCMILPIPFVTAEYLSQMIAESIYKKIDSALVFRVKVTVLESERSEATFTVHSQL